MMSCQSAKDLIESVVDGTIDSDQLDALKTHTETCAACRAEFERCTLVEEVVKDAFVSSMEAEQAGRRIAEQIASRPQSPVRVVHFGAGWARLAVAATMVLAAGLLIGFVTGRTQRGEPVETVPLETVSRVRVPMRVGEIQGTVLVRHEDSDSWLPVERNDDVYLGDTFHTTATSGLTLTLDDTNRVEIAQNSMLALESYDTKTTQFYLEHGQCTPVLNGPHGPFFIKTPHGLMQALGTEFTVTVE